MKSSKEYERVRFWDRQMWQCHWHVSGRSCEEMDGMMDIKKQETALHAAYEFVFRIFYSDFPGGDPIRQGDGIVCVHDHTGRSTLVGVEWWLGKGLEGYSRFVRPDGRSLHVRGQAGLWSEAGDWSPSELSWGGLVDDGIGTSRYPLRIEEPEIESSVMHTSGLSPQDLNWANNGAPFGESHHHDEWKTKRVLLVEDYPPDVKAFEEAISRSKDRFDWTILQDGQDCLDFLHCRGPYKDSWRPDLLVLNLNLPRVYGLRILERIRKNPNLRSMPILIWTISMMDCDIREAYRLGVSGYFVKPVNTKELVRQVVSMLDFIWWRAPNPCEQEGCKWASRFSLSSTPHS